MSESLTYQQSVQPSERLTLPAPDLPVPIVGVVGLGVVASSLLGRVSRLAAVLVLPVVLVTIGPAGHSWQHRGALTAVCGLLGVETLPGGRAGSKPTR